MEEATREIEAENARLRDAGRLKDEHVATVAHELRTPLTSIRSFAEIMQDEPDMPAAQRSAFLAIVVTECERLMRLIDQLLDLSRIEAGHMRWDVRDVAVEDIVREATQSLAPVFGRDGVMLAVAPLPVDLPPVRADGDRVIQVLVNLLFNAEKFCRKPGGTVAVGVRRDGPMARFSVIDDGPGVAEAERAAIFERFYQASGGPAAAGSGLGLAISERIVSGLGGRIWLEAREDGATGSVFHFTLPLAPTACVPSPTTD